MVIWAVQSKAGLLEIAWAVGLKYAEGFSKFWPSVWTIIGMIASFFFLSQAVRTLPVGTGYAVWTGIGAVGTAILGVILFDESMSPWRVASLLLVVAGIVGLKISSGH